MLLRLSAEASALEGVFCLPRFSQPGGSIYLMLAYPKCELIEARVFIV